MNSEALNHDPTDTNPEAPNDNNPNISQPPHMIPGAPNDDNPNVTQPHHTNAEAPNNDNPNVAQPPHTSLTMGFRETPCAILTLSESRSVCLFIVDWISPVRNVIFEIQISVN